MLIPQRRDKFWQCSYCEAEYPEKDKAQKCVASHNLILVPIAKEDLSRLLQFIFTHEEKLLSSSLIRIIQKYSYQSSATPLED